MLFRDRDASAQGCSRPSSPRCVKWSAFLSFLVGRSLDSSLVFGDDVMPPMGVANRRLTVVSDTLGVDASARGCSIPSTSSMCSFSSGIVS